MFNNKINQFSTGNWAIHLDVVMVSDREQVDNNHPFLK